MNKYNVVITETLKKTIEIEAESRQDAERIATDNWHKSEYILDADDFSQVSFEAVRAREKMNIRIYQIDKSQDKNNVRFMRYDSLEKLQGTSNIDSGIYQKVFEGEVDCKELEDVYMMFNKSHPKDYKGRSLSVSDVVEIIDGDSNSTFHFCDSFGFRKVEFDPSEIQVKDMIRVVLLEPGKLSRVTEIDSSLEGLQTVVKGLIEPCYYFDDVCLVVNDEGKINGMQLNRAIYNEEKEMVDIIAGPAFICGLNADSFCSLTDEQAEKYAEMFKHPERFLKLNGKINAVPYTPSINLER